MGEVPGNPVSATEPDWSRESKRLWKWAPAKSPLASIRTIGIRDGGIPTIGGHVDIGAGAKVLGAIRVEDHACIGANAVVLQDVSARATAVGMSARIVLPSDSRLRAAESAMPTPS